MKKKIALLLALIMLLGSFSMLTISTGAETPELWTTQGAQTYVREIGSVNGQNIEVDTRTDDPSQYTIKVTPYFDGTLEICGWLCAMNGVSKYVYTVDGGSEYLIPENYVLMNIAGLGSVAGTDISNSKDSNGKDALQTNSLQVRINVSDLEAGKNHVIALYAVTGSGKYCLAGQFEVVSYFGFDYYKTAMAAIDAKYVVAIYDPNNTSDGIYSINYSGSSAIGVNKGWGEIDKYAYLGNYNRKLWAGGMSFADIQCLVIDYITQQTLNVNATTGDWVNITEPTILLKHVGATVAEIGRMKIDEVTNLVPSRWATTYAMPCTERTGVMEIKDHRAGLAPHFISNEASCSISYIKALKVDYAIYKAEVDALNSKMAEAASVDEAIEACDNLSFWAKDAAGAEAKLDTLVKASLNNESVTVSYANGAIADGKYTVDVIYTFEGISYTDKVEVAISDKAVVGAQSKDNGNGTYSVRFVATVDDYTAYDEIGFEIVADYEAGIYAETGKTYDVKCYEVFDSILSLEDGTTVINNAGDFHGKYLMALTVDGIPTETGAAGFTVKAYYVAKGSTERIYTDVVTFDAVGGEVVD